MPQHFDMRIAAGDIHPIPVGWIKLHGRIEGGKGVLPKRPMRIYGSYAVVLITAGRGRYLDANGYDQVICLGDMICVFPGLPHAYGPDDSTVWDEYYIVFDGLAATTLVEWRLLTPEQPVISLSDAELWRARMADVVEHASTSSPESGFFRLAALIAEARSPTGVPHQRSKISSWVAKACRLLAADLTAERSIEGIAEECGVGYSTFRRKFRADIGVSPADFRNRKRIDTAKDLLKFTSSTLGKIAAQLGFNDQYHFSKQFKQATSKSPSQFRNEQETFRG